MILQNRQKVFGATNISDQSSFTLFCSLTSSPLQVVSPLSAPWSLTQMQKMHSWTWRCSQRTWSLPSWPGLPSNRGNECEGFFWFWNFFMWTWSWEVASDRCGSPLLENSRPSAVFSAQATLSNPWWKSNRQSFEFPVSCHVMRWITFWQICLHSSLWIALHYMQQCHSSHYGWWVTIILMQLRATLPDSRNSIKLNSA